MRSRSYSPSSYAIGPGPWTPAVRAIIIATVAGWVLTSALPATMIEWFGLTPQDVITRGRIWQPLTYLFVHDPLPGLFHILFNMLAVWMFGIDLERRWGSVGFAKYYFVTGVGAGLIALAVSLLPLEIARQSYGAATIGASGAVYGLLLAYALFFPHRQIIFIIFPMPARIFVLLVGAIALLGAVSAPGSGVSHIAHLGGALVGWLYLKGPTDLRLELNYRLTKWRMARMRRKFDVHSGGRDDWRNRIH